VNIAYYTKHLLQSYTTCAWHAHMTCHKRCWITNFTLAWYASVQCCLLLSPLLLHCYVLRIQTVATNNAVTHHAHIAPLARILAPSQPLARPTHGGEPKVSEHLAVRMQADWRLCSHTQAANNSADADSSVATAIVHMAIFIPSGTPRPQRTPYRKCRRCQLLARLTHTHSTARSLCMRRAAARARLQAV
jgi:hypothetical protein